MRPGVFAGTVPDGKKEGFPSGPASGYQCVSLSKSISHKNRLF